MSTSERLQTVHDLALRWKEHADDADASNTDKVLGAAADQILEITQEGIDEFERFAREARRVVAGEGEFKIIDHDLVYVPFDT